MGSVCCCEREKYNTKEVESIYTPEYTFEINPSILYHHQVQDVEDEVRMRLL